MKDSKGMVDVKNALRSPESPQTAISLSRTTGYHESTVAVYLRELVSRGTACKGKQGYYLKPKVRFF